MAYKIFRREMALHDHGRGGLLPSPGRLVQPTPRASADYSGTPVFFVCPGAPEWQPFLAFLPFPGLQLSISTGAPREEMNSSLLAELVGGTSLKAKVANPEPASW
jgi:hypothetical protein